MNSANQPPERTPFEIFNGALDIGDSTELQAYLDRACQGDAALRAQVENLLAHHQADSFLEHAALAAVAVKEAPRTLDPAREASPASVAPWGNIKYFGDYELLEEIARGGMGVVYKARQTSLNRIVAVKMILAGQLASEADIRRFHTEAEAAANLQHPNIVAIHEVGEHEERHYFSMDYVEGQNLAALVRERPLPPARAAELVKTIAEAIQYAHQRGILHRDLKPQNVLIDEHDRPRVTDFGLAKHAGADSNLTLTGAVMGSPSYMPPEQATGRHDQVGPHSDVYSLGAILYELLTGKAPFLGETPLATLQKVVGEDPAAPSMHNPQTPPDLETICLKCLEKKPERRYPTARALAEELERFLNHEPILARPASEWRKALSWMRKRPWLITGALALIGAVAVIGLAGLVYGLWEHSQLLAWRIDHRGESSPYRKGKDFVNAHPTPFVWVKLTLPLLLVPYFIFYFRRKKNRPVSTRLFTFFTTCALAMLALGIAQVLLIVKLTVWTSWDTARSLGPGYFYGSVYVFIALGFLLNLFLQRQSQWFGQELINPVIFRAEPPPSIMPKPDCFSGRYLPEFVTLQEASRRGQLLKRVLPGCGVIFGSCLLAIAGSRDWEWASVMFVFGLMSAHAICMLTVGSVPASLRRHIIENYALFLPGRKEKNFIIYGFLNLFNLALGGITILPKEYSIPVASGVLGGLSLATLVMLLTLRSIRRGEKGETPTEAVRETATAGKR
ncbi:MAG TPA: serine/threonine-protein kinase [Verrucomicrobiae bacterium]|nr:serine/threonine-protein kinase [Verrucomicrobiae bacterium]